MWWVCTIPGVGKWFTLGVIQALITYFDLPRPVLNSSTSGTELFTLLQCDSTAILKLPAIALRTPLGRMIYPLVWKNYQNESKQILNYLDESPNLIQGYCLQVRYFRGKQYLPVLYISNALLVSAVLVKMKLGDNGCGHIYDVTKVYLKLVSGYVTSYLTIVSAFGRLCGHTTQLTTVLITLCKFFVCCFWFPPRARFTLGFYFAYLISCSFR